MPTPFWENVILYYWKKNYPKELIWGAVNVVASAANVWGALRPLVVPSNKALMGSIEAAELTNKFPFVTDTNLYKSLIWMPKLCAPIFDKTISKWL